MLIIKIDSLVPLLFISILIFSLSQKKNAAYRALLFVMDADCLRIFPTIFIIPVLALFPFLILLDCKIS